MAKVVNVRVTVKRVRNLGNYESATAEATVEVALDDGDDESIIIAAARRMALQEVGTQIAPFDDAIASRVNTIFDGLPPTLQNAIKIEEEKRNAD